MGIFNEEGEFELNGRARKVLRGVGFYLLCVLCCNVLAYLYVKNSHFIYFWDNATYWDISKQIATGGQGRGLELARKVYESMLHSDYNMLIALLPAACMRLFGTSRLVYILSLVNLYTVPSLVVLYLTARRQTRSPAVAVVLAALFTPAMLFLGMAGFADVAGIGICFLCFFLVQPGTGQKKEKLPWWKGLILGALLVLLMLMRRWYAFFAVSFLTAMAAECVLQRRKPIALIMAILTAGGILVLFFQPFITEKLLTDYGQLYAGYKFSIPTDLKLFARYFGILPVCLFACSVWTMVREKEFHLAFYWIQMVSCFLMFIATQTHGQQHLLLYIPAFMMLLIQFLPRLRKWPSFLLVSVFAVVFMVNPFLLRQQPQSISEIEHYALVPDFSMRPRQRDDADSVLQLKQYLDEAVPEGKKVGILASSFVINGDILRNVEPSLNVEPSREDYIVQLPEVDSRDTDLTPLYTTDYMLVAYPAQIHLPAENQNVILEAVNSFEAQTDIAAAYEPEGGRRIVGGVSVQLYRKVRNANETEIAAFHHKVQLFT